MLKEFFVCCIFFCAMLINAVTGFAGNLLAMPTTIQLIGMTDAKVMSTIVGIVTCAVIAALNPKAINWYEIIKAILLMIPGILFGLYLFYNVNYHFLLYVYGSIILIIAVKNFFTKPLVYKMTLPLVLLIMTGAGIMHSLFVSSGAFMVIYAMHTFKDKSEFRATMVVLGAFLNILLLFQEIIAKEITLYNTGLMNIKGQNIIMTRGDTAALTLIFTGDEVPDGTDVRFTVKKAAEDETTLIVKTMKAEGNRAVLTLEPADTKTMRTGQYCYDVRLETTLADGTKEKLTPMVYGVFQLLENVGV